MFNQYFLHKVCEGVWGGELNHENGSFTKWGVAHVHQEGRSNNNDPRSIKCTFAGEERWFVRGEVGEESGYRKQNWPLRLPHQSIRCGSTTILVCLVVATCKRESRGELQGERRIEERIL